MRVFGSIVHPQPLLMRASQSQTPERRGVGAQLVGDQQFGGEALLLEQLAHQPQRRPAVASALDQHVEDLALVVDGPPEEFLDVPIAQGEAQVEPYRMLDDDRRKAMVAVGYLSHRASLPLVSSPSYPVILTKPGGRPDRSVEAL